MRERTSKLATEWLGSRTELEIQQNLRREVDQERWTSLDRMLQREAQGGLIRVNQPANDPGAGARVITWRVGGPSRCRTGFADDGRAWTSCARCNGPWAACRAI